MAKKATKTPQKVEHTCGECGWGVFIDEFTNLDVNGKPICLRCKFAEYARLRTAKACDKWKAKIRK